jgi:hypothetical protein
MDFGNFKVEIELEDIEIALDFKNVISKYHMEEDYSNT